VQVSAKCEWFGTTIFGGCKGLRGQELGIKLVDQMAAHQEAAYEHLCRCVYGKGFCEVTKVEGSGIQGQAGAVEMAAHKEA
jgi:hypothetical protein